MTDGEPETVVSARLQKIKSIKNPNFPPPSPPIKSETSDSFVSHCDGHFAFLKTLDFYFNRRNGLSAYSLRVQQLCENRGGRPGLSVLTSIMVSVDVKQH